MEIIGILGLPLINKAFENKSAIITDRRRTVYIICATQYIVSCQDDLNM